MLEKLKTFLKINLRRFFEIKFNMVYMGSKNRIAKFIVPILNKFNDRDIYIEPFVGGGNIIDKVDYKIKKGYDKNVYLIELLKYVSKGGELPRTISEEEYHNVRNNIKDYPYWYVGLVGFCASCSGRFFNGFANKGWGISTRDRVGECIRNLSKQSTNLENVFFDCFDYKELDFSNLFCVGYFDPPYSNGLSYKTSLLGKFDSNEFWDYTRKQSEQNICFISEYTAPQDFKIVWEGLVRKNLNKKEDRSLVSEKLFVHEKWIEEVNKRINIL